MLKNTQKKKLAQMLRKLSKKVNKEELTRLEELAAQAQSRSRASGSSERVGRSR